MTIEFRAVDGGKTFVLYGASLVADMIATGQADVNILVTESETARDTTLGYRNEAEGFRNEAEIHAIEGVNIRAASGELVGTAKVETIGNNVADNSTLATTTTFYSPVAQTGNAGWLKSISLRIAGDTTIKLVVVDSQSITRAEKTVALTGTGVVTEAIGDLWVPAGGRVYFSVVSGTGYRRGVVGAGAGRTFTTASYIASPQAVVEASSTTDTSFSYVVASVDDGAGVTSKIGTLAPTLGTTTVGLPRAHGVAVAGDVLLTKFTGKFATAGAYRLLMVDRYDVVIWAASYTAATTGIIVENIANVPMPAGSRLYFDGNPAQLRYSAGGSNRFFASTEFNGTIGDTVIPRWDQTTPAFTYEVVRVPVGSLEKRIEKVAADSAERDRIARQMVADERIIDAKADIGAAELELVTTATLSRSGYETAISDTRTFTAATNARYDLLYYDSAAGTVGVIAGTDRATDAAEYIPQPALPSQVPLFNVRVTATAVEPVAIWPVLGGEDRRLTVALEQERVRSREALRRFRTLIRRGSAVKIVGFGDSITAVQNASGGTATPNGAARDRGVSAGAGYLEVGGKLGADLLATVPFYTAVQLGRADDGAGATHTRVGWNWELVAALEAVGYTLGTDLTYDNFGIGGTNTTSAWTAGAPTTWLTNAVNLSVDLAVVALGMNELGATTTEANMVKIIETFQNAGTEVLIVGVPRSGVSTNYLDWRYTHRALERAARFTGAAFLSMIPIYDNPHIGVLGMTGNNVCTANRTNHPGLLEFRTIGRELSKLVAD